MSAKRSWDVRREVRGASAAPQTPARRRETLKDKRTKQKRIFLIVLGVLLVLLLAGLVYLMWQPFVRITSVSSEGPNAQDAKLMAEEALVGTYAYVLPRDSIFIFPEGSIRRQILNTHPAITAVSISRASFTSISIKTVPRASAFMWCGASAELRGPCYQADAEGFIFADEEGREAVAVAVRMDMLTEPSFEESIVMQEVVEEEPIIEDVDMSVLRIYAPLEREGETPIRAHVVGASRLPDALRFVKAMKELGVGIVSVEIREDEADLYTPEGTRITYILGDEEEAAKLAASSFPSLNVSSGALQYVDLRFEGKVYVKRHNEGA